MKKLYLLGIVGLFLSFQVFGETKPYPSSLWSSHRFSEALLGIRVARVLESTKNHVVVLSRNQLQILEVGKESQSEKTVFKVKAKPGEEWMKLDTMDVDGDGLDEIIINGFYHDEVFGLIAKIKNSELVREVLVSHYLYSINWQNQKILVGQKRYGSDDFSGPLLHFVYENKKLILKNKFILVGDKSNKSPSLFSVYGISLDNQDGYLFLNSEGTLSFYKSENQKFKRKWSSGLNYGGPVIYFNREVKNFLNQTDKKRYFVPVSLNVVSNDFLPVVHSPVVKLEELAEEVSPKEKDEKTKSVEPNISVSVLPPVFQKKPEDADLRIYVSKNSGYLKNITGVVPSVKNSQMLKLQWTGYGFQETWNSPRLDGAISDFTIVDWDGDGKEEVVAILLLRDDGYVDTLVRQDSLVLVLKTRVARDDGT